MFFIDVTNPWILLVALFLTICLIYIGKEAKNAKVPMMSLIVFLVLLVMHSIQVLLLNEQYASMTQTLSRCLIVDFLMIFISFAAFLWIDDIEAQAKNKKSLNDSLKWLFKNV